MQGSAGSCMQWGRRQQLQAPGANSKVRTRPTKGRGRTVRAELLADLVKV